MGTRKSNGFLHTVLKMAKFIWRLFKFLILLAIIGIALCSLLSFFNFKFPALNIPLPFENKMVESDESLGTPAPTQENLAETSETPYTNPTLVAETIVDVTSTSIVTASPTTAPTATPVVTASPTTAPTATPTPVVTASPTTAPTATPTPVVTASPTTVPTATPTPVVTASPTVAPTSTPTPVVTASPTATQTPFVTALPTIAPTATPTPVVTVSPTTSPTSTPTSIVTASPTVTPTPAPTSTPVFYAYTTNLSLTEEIVNNLLLDSEYTIAEKDISISVKNETIFFTSEQHLIQLEFTPSILEQLKNAQISQINMQNHINLNIDKMLASAKEFEVSKIRFVWKKENINNSYQYGLVFEQSMLSLILKGKCTFDLINTY